MATIATPSFRPNYKAANVDVRNKLNEKPISAGHRHSEIDLIKSLAIVTVVLIHCIKDRPFQSDGGLQKLLSDWARFAVPWFLFAAGFLFPKDGASGWAVFRKLSARIVPPYVICSLVWMVYAVFRAKESYDVFRLLRELLIGQVCGIFYFVFVISYLYVLGISLRRAPRYVAHVACGLAFVALVATNATWPILTYPGSVNVNMRHPFLHAFPFLLGWVVAIHQVSLRESLRRLRRRDVLSLAVADVATLGVLQTRPLSPWPSGPWPSGDWLRDLLIQLHIYLFLILVLHVGLRIKRPWKGIRFLSENSYGIYLVHMGFVVELHKAFRGLGAYEFGGRIFISCGIALGLTVLVIVVTRHCMGSRSKVLIGA